MNFDSSSYFWRKIVAICPLCHKPIQGKDLEFKQLDEVKHWPAPLTCHHCSETQPVKLWVDAHYTVRSIEACPPTPPTCAPNRVLP